MCTSSQDWPECNQRNRETVDMTTKVGVVWRVSKCGSRNSRANRHQIRGINKRRLAGDECFQPVPENEEEELEEIVLENKLTWDNLAEGIWLFKTTFDLFHDMDPAKIWALQLKPTVEELELYKNIVNQHIPCTLGNYIRDDQGDSFRFLWHQLKVTFGNTKVSNTGITQGYTED